MPTWVDIVVKLTPAFVTLVVGVVASGIAFLQYRISRNKLRLDLFSKRLEAYERLREYFGFVFRDGTVDDKTLTVLWDARHKSRFLFKQDIEVYLEELTQKAVHLQTLGLRWTPKIGQRGSLSPTSNPNDPDVQETSSA